MKLSPVQLAVALILACVIFRLLSGVFCEAIPNFSPLMALAFVGAIYLPRKWGWLVGAAAFVVTDLAFVTANYRVEGFYFSWLSLISLAIYLLAAGLGLVISRHKSLLKIAAGSIACSVAFYLAANTFCWASSAFSHTTPGYAATLAGWWQANTVGLPGYVPTWTFLRNGIAGDLFFSAVLLLIFDRALLFHPATAKSAAVTRAA